MVRATENFIQSLSQTAFSIFQPIFRLFLFLLTAAVGQLQD